MLLNLLLVLAAVVALAWWLSGFDSQLTGENRRADFLRRAIRCALTLLLVGVALAAAAGGGRVGGFVCIALIVPLAITWSGCVSELFAGVFHRLIDSPDDRELDPKELDRDLDRLAELSQQHRYGEAIQLCVKLKESAAGSGLGLEATLFRLYDEMFADGTTSPHLAEVQKLYEGGQCLLAESRLNQVLKREPGNLGAGILLMKLYARNLRNANRALALLHTLEQQRGVPPGFIDYARERIRQWFDPASEPKPEAEGIESILVRKRPTPPLEEEESDPNDLSIDELLEAGHLGTAIERLETQIKEHPADFDLRLRLAEAHGLYCCNISRASDIVTKIQTDPAFSPAQARKAQARLLEWRTRRSEG